MYLRSQRSRDELVGGTPIIEYARNNLYPTAYPFDRCKDGNPGSIAHVALHGYNGAVTSLADLWQQNIARTYPTAGFTFAVSSSSASDDGAPVGTGALEIEVDVLDTDYVPHTIPIVLNGQTKVEDTTLVGNAFRINDIRITAWGTGAQNAGDIYVYDTTDAVTAGVPQTDTKIFHKIPATGNTPRGAFYTVPAGCSFQAQQVRGGFNDSSIVDRSGVISLRYYTDKAGIKIPTYFPLVGQVNLRSPGFTITPDFPVIFDEKTDIVLQATCSGSAIMTAYLDGIIYYK
jgi:hypothetical protein